MNQDSLLAQLASRTKSYKQATGLTSRQICKLTNISEQSLCDFLAGRQGLGAEGSIALWKLTRISKAQAEMKLNKPVTSEIVHFHEAKPMRFDGSGWVPQEGKDNDPDGSTGITDTPTATGREDIDDDLDRVLAEAKSLHQRAIDVLSGYEARKVEKARVQNGPSNPPKKISDNTTSKTPGPRSDLLNSPEHQKRMLTILAAAQAEAEEALELKQKVKDQWEATNRARQELAKFDRHRA